MTDDALAAEARLLHGLAAHEWLRGEAVQAIASAGQLDRERYKVTGLDDTGQATGRVDRTADLIESVIVDEGGAGHVAVRGGHPRCAAVGLYQAARFDHAWLLITAHRIAILRLRDERRTDERAVDQIIAEAGQRSSLRSALHGIGKIVKTSATEFTAGMRRPPLAERPQDATLDCPFEAPRTALRAIGRWRQPLVPEFNGGPRFVQVHFADDSWARLRTDQPGLAALTGEH